jgi:hypothetical protein
MIQRSARQEGGSGQGFGNRFPHLKILNKIIYILNKS